MEKYLKNLLKFARLCFQSFGDRVSHWITLNEPFICSWGTWDLGIMAPFVVKEPLQGPYKAMHNLLQAHALTYKLYKTEFAHQKGKIGLSVEGINKIPKDPNSKEDVEAANKALAFQVFLLLIF
jgi:beta-glucosidase